MTNDKDEALKLALELAEDTRRWGESNSARKAIQTITAIKKALAPTSTQCEVQPTSADYAMGYAEGFNDACKKPEQELMAYIRKDQLQKAAQSAMLCEVTPEPRKDRIRIYTTPQASVNEAPKRPWIGLTDEEIIKTFNAICNGKPFDVERILEVHRAIEAKLKELNT